MIVVGFEAVAGGRVISYWFDAPLWVLSLILMVTMTATKLFSVASFGEFEFWFAGIKVAAIVVFLGPGSLFVLGLWPHHSMDFGNLAAHGGFFPRGVGTTFGAVAVVISAMVGAEVATIAAAETVDPERAVQRATRSVMFRILIFYVGSVFLLAAIVPLAAAHQRPDTMLTALRIVGLHADGEAGDERPMHALADAVERFRPDQLVIVDDRSTWLRLQLAKRARSAYAIPVTEVLSGEPAMPSAR